MIDFIFIGESIKMVYGGNGSTKVEQITGTRQGRLRLDNKKTGVLEFFSNKD